MAVVGTFGYQKLRNGSRTLLLPVLQLQIVIKDVREPWVAGLRCLS